MFKLILLHQYVKQSNDEELLLCYCLDAASFTATPIWFK